MAIKSLTIILFLGISLAHGESFFKVETLNCQTFDCYAFGSGVGEGTVDHAIRDYYSKEEIDDIREEYPPLLSFLPIGRQRSLKKRIYLPLPLGTAVNFAYLNQGMEFDNPNKSDAGIDDARDKRVGLTARAGFWLFRFLNIYMTGGYAWGEAEGKLTSKTNTSDFDIKIKYQGGNVGVGGTFAIGISKFFAVFDGNYSWNFFDLSDETVKAYTLSPKVGMMIPSKKMGTGSFYVGAMFLDFKMAFEGKIPSNNEPFKLYASPKENWNFIFGGSWEFNPHWSIAAEAGVGERKQFVLSGGFRF